MIKNIDGIFHGQWIYPNKRYILKQDILYIRNQDIGEERRNE